jgi:ribonuclease PH
MKRDFSVVLGALDNNDASAVVRSGKTEVACGIFGPLDARGTRDSYEGLIVDVSTRGCIALPTHTHRHIDCIISDIVLRCIDSVRFPYMQLNVAIEVLSDDGCLLSVIGNAVYFALVDSGLPMKYRFVALPMNLVGRQLVADTHIERETRCSASLTVFVNVDSPDHLYLIQESGEVPVELYEQLSMKLKGICEAELNALTAALVVPEQRLRFSR